LIDSRKNTFALLALVLVSGILVGSVYARTVKFRELMTTYHAGTAEDVQRVIDGWEASPKGWSVEPNFGEAQAAIFVAESPIEADLLNLTMFFMAGRPNASFANFSLRYTTDEMPSFQGEWHDLPMINFGATTSKLKLAKDNRLIAEEVTGNVTGKIPDDHYWITARAPGKAITGFRIDVFPVFRRPEFSYPDVSAGPLMSWSRESDFVLTEFRAEVVTTTTNVALGAPVTATHALYIGMTADALTDGWPSTIAHPQEGVDTKDFAFEIDLGKERLIDHLTLRQRGDPYDLDRFGKMRIRLYDADRKGESTPTWQVLNRPDGSYPALGEADLLRAADGKGSFRGRYLRISTENPVPLSPMLAEVEVYETRTAHLVSVKADEQLIPSSGDLRIPAGAQRLALQWKIPQSGSPYDALYRWRLLGVNGAWQSSDSLLLEIPCPPPGDFILEIQAAHSDGTWDSSVMRMPFAVAARFTETAAFLWLIGGVTLLIGVLISRVFARLKIARLEAKSALAAERSRIARNMHDDVGARLAQLAVLQDVFSREHPLPPDAQADLAALTSCAREAMESLDEAVWTVNPRNDTLTALASFLAQHADRYLSPLGIVCRIDGLDDLPEVTLRTGTRHEVALAFKEALQNIVKHAAASEVEVTLQYGTERLTLRVADNGCGFPQKGGNPGEDGLLNMRQRLAFIGGTCEWLPGHNGGTIVEMKFPLS